MLKLFSRYGITLILKLKKEMRNNWNKATVERVIHSILENNLNISC